MQVVAEDIAQFLAELKLNVNVIEYLFGVLAYQSEVVCASGIMVLMQSCQLFFGPRVTFAVFNSSH